MPAAKDENNAAANGGNKAANNSGGIVTLVNLLWKSPEPLPSAAAKRSAKQVEPKRHVEPRLQRIMPPTSYSPDSNLLEEYLNEIFTLAR
jgi:hypothetical protein